jgi:pimeloyl-ACP methyl ester carboxylesterase
MQPFIQQEVHIIAGTGHLVFYDAQPLVARELLQFMREFCNRVY